MLHVFGLWYKLGCFHTTFIESSIKVQPLGDFDIFFPSKKWKLTFHVACVWPLAWYKLGCFLGFCAFKLSLEQKLLG